MIEDGCTKEKKMVILVNHIQNLLTIFWMLLFPMKQLLIKIASSVLVVNARNCLTKQRDDVMLHLQQYGFIPNYTIWWAHGETTTFQHEVQPPNPMEDDDFDGC